LGVYFYDLANCGCLVFWDFTGGKEITLKIVTKGRDVLANRTWFVNYRSIDSIIKKDSKQ
jgi:hypothetical protein